MRSLPQAGLRKRFGGQVMGAADQEEITQVLAAIQSGDRQAAGRLLPLVYAELRSLARARLSRTPPGHTLQPTALVHEVYLRLVGDQDPGWQGRGHFFGAAARAMRDILVEHARRKGARKRGAGRERVELDGAVLAGEAPADEVLALDEALRTLEAEDPAKAEIVILRYFGGLTNEEVAVALGTSPGSVQRQWRYIRAWLRKHLANGNERDS